VTECGHPNAPGHAFCTTCGQPLLVQRCRCGFACGADDQFCGRCGTSLAKATAKETEAGPTQRQGRYSLRHFLDLQPQVEPAKALVPGKMIQDDIRSLVASFRKRKAKHEAL